MQITRRGSSTFVALICCIVCTALGIYYGFSQLNSKNAPVIGVGSEAVPAPLKNPLEPVPIGTSPGTFHPPTPPHFTSGTARWAPTAGSAAFARPTSAVDQHQTTTATATF